MHRSEQDNAFYYLHENGSFDEVPSMAAELAPPENFEVAPTDVLVLNAPLEVNLRYEIKLTNGNPHRIG